MIRLTVCLLFSTAALAQHYGYPGAPTPMPMDYNEDIYNRDMRIQPSSSFVFNFEQARRDQPPQIEMREENLGKYMGRPRTTAAPLPMNPSLIGQRVPEMDSVHLHHLSTEPVSMKPYVQQHWDPISSHLPATLPAAPTTPKWMDLSDDVFKHHSHHKPSRHPVNSYQPAPTPPPVPQWTQPAPAPYLQPLPPQPEMSYSNQMPQYARPSSEYSAPRSAPARGSHKFSWDDLALPEQAPAMPTTTPRAALPSQKRGPPPSVPTLSPWADGFGK